MTTLERILYLKEKKGISDLALERELGLKSRVVSEWKRRTSESYMKVIPALAAYFNVTADYLLGLTDDPSPPNSDISIDEFTFAFHREAQELTEDDKDMLLRMARQLRERMEQKKKNEQNDKI